MNNIVEALQLKISDKLLEYTDFMELVKVTRKMDNSIFSFFILAKKIIPTNVKENIKNIIENDYLNNKATANIIVSYDIDIEEYKNNVKEFYNIVKDDIYEYLSTINKMYASIYKSAIINTYNENNTIELVLAKNVILKDIYIDIVKIVAKYILDRYNFVINVIYKESEDIKKQKVNKHFMEKNEFIEKRRLELEKYEKELEIENKKEKEENDENTNIFNKKYFDKKRKKTSRIFYNDGDIQIFGKYIVDNVPIMNIEYFVNDIENVYIKGIIFRVDVKERTKKKDGKKFCIVEFDITDGQNAIKNSIFLYDMKSAQNAKEVLKIGFEVVVHGNVKKDEYNDEICMKDIDAIKKIGEKEYIKITKKKEEDNYNIFVTDRVDEENDKRVELHLHTKLSEQDGTGAIEDYIKACSKFGMQSIAITDHGVVQALPVAYNYIKSEKEKNKLNDIKLILGVEGYLVDDEISLYFDNNFEKNVEKMNIDETFLVIDLLTTGINYNKDLILAINVTKIKSKQIVCTKNFYIKPKRHLTFEEKNNANVKESDLQNGISFKEALMNIVDLMYEDGNNACICGLNIKKIYSFMKKYVVSDNDEIENEYFSKINKLFDMYSICKFLIKDIKKFTRESIIKSYGIGKEIKKITKDKNEQKAIINSNLYTAKIMINILNDLFTKHKISNISEVNEKFVIDNNFIKLSPYNHIVLLAKNDVGKVNLYKLVSDSHISFFSKKPRMPKSLIKKYREGIIIGSACVQGELIEALINGEDDDRLKDIASFYDYLEVQPIYNNSFLLNNPKYNNMFTTDEDLKNINRKVVNIGDSLNKLVVATCDCHYVDKEDKIFRTILQYNLWHKKSNLDKDGKVKVSDSEEAGSEKEELYFRTTTEMLKEFDYLGDEKAFEIVVKNTNVIADMCESIVPTRPDKCPPSIENAEDELRNSCMKKAEELYGKNIPEIIKNRLDVELHTIIDNGYSVMYITAKLLIDDSVKNGYMVGSRGSVGSSLVATMIGVSEVNPLPPHYYCPKCQHVEIDTEETKAYLNETGFDMPDKECPICHTMMKKDGINIPFETFLGVEGGKPKEPDIDLNFSGEYHTQAHKKTRDIFGDDFTYKVGTVSTVAKETSFAYINKYNKENYIISKKADVEYQKTGITDCKKSTGQHPGGMVVVPNDEYIYTFTPIQYPANKEDKGKTTHFEYHLIEQNLLKLDMLGQDGPTFIKKLYDLTKINPMDVPFYEKEVISLFQDTSSISITPSDIHNEKLGCLSIPEFGTPATMKMCMEAKPKSVGDLVRIAGLAHGEDVWVGNIRDIVLSHTASIKECVCCRDDIMTYLNERGIDNALSFEIMEKVRKGKGLESNWEEKMRDKGVPEWYIGCCNKIKYMFPKAHAAAYVTTSLRVGYYKVHFPLEYYTAYFSIKWNRFDYELMCVDIETLRFNLDKVLKERRMRNGINVEDDDFENDDDVEDIEEEEDDDSGIRTANQDKKEKNLIIQLKICEECLARGIEFTPIDIYKAKPFDFIIVDGKIMPSLATINGLGKDKVVKFYEKAHEKPFTSKEDLVKRGGLNQTVIKKMMDYGMLPELRDKEEMTISDYL